MKLTQLFTDGKLHLSFEVFPPKTDAAFDTVKNSVEKIAELKPSFISVTYGAGGGTSQYTLDIAKLIAERHGVPSLAHLTCVSSSKESVHRQIEAIKAAGIRNVMALRGDLTPELEASDRSRWDYRHASDLIAELRACGADLCIGGACYPEVHPESADSREDILHLKEKVEAGCDFLTTQMFFDNALYYSFLYRIREAGITVPVLPGIMPITNAKQLERAVKLSGSFIPHRFMALVDRFGENPLSMEQAGIVYATGQIIDLFANGILNVHVYTMNKPHVAARIMENLSCILN